MLVPCPGFPSAILACHRAGKRAIPYFLDAAFSWTVAPALDFVKQFMAKSSEVRVLLLQNPGPHGQLLSMDCLQRCLELAQEHGLAVVVQEDHTLVRQNFVSCRQVALQHGFDVPVTCVAIQDLAELNGQELGACLHSPGLPQMVQASSRAQAWISSLLSGIPQESPQYVAAREQELRVREELSLNARNAHLKLNDGGMTCVTPVAGAYVFPQVVVKGFVMKKAISLGRPADDVYCSEMLQRIGVHAQPGCSFGQRPGSFHFRLALGQSTAFRELLDEVRQFHDEHPRGWFR